MSSQTANAGTVADDSTVGDGGWTGHSNVGASDGSFATIDLDSTGAVDVSYYLKCTNFGFSTSGTIDGVQAFVVRKASQSTASKYAVDFSVRLVKGGTISGSDKADVTTKYLTTLDTAFYGGSTDLWGLTLNASDVNASNFGFVFSTDGTRFTSTQTVSVDEIGVTVYYTVSSSGVPIRMRQTRQMRALQGAIWI